jgi:putative oxidoreductase
VAGSVAGGAGSLVQGLAAVAHPAQWPTPRSGPHRFLENFMQDRVKDLLALAGRILLATLFVLSGFGKIMGYPGTAAYMRGHGLPWVEVLLPLTIAMELGGGLGIVLGFLTRPIALLFFVFLIPVTLVFHTAGDQANTIQLLKNISIMGAMLQLAAFGPGALALDKLRRA